jgi:hypothetical protein
MCLVLISFGTVGWIYQPPVCSLLFLALSLPILGSFAFMGIVTVVVVIGRRGRP